MQEFDLSKAAKARIAAILAAILFFPLIGQLADKRATPSAPPVQEAPAPASALPSVQVAQPRSSGAIEAAFRNHSDRLPVLETGTVSRILSDDNEGSRHQRFIVQLASGHTVLIAHNIDIAPRISSLREGDQVTFSGLCEWNDKGGVVHWTHHDPSGRYGGGYLQHNGNHYQ